MPARVGNSDVESGYVPTYIGRTCGCCDPVVELWQNLDFPQKMGGAAFCAFIPILTAILLIVSIRHLGPEDQMVISSPYGKEVYHGPTSTFVPLTKSVTYRKAIRLTPKQYARVRNTRSGKLRHEVGPDLLWLGAWDELVQVREKINLQMLQYVRLVDTITGQAEVQQGPQQIVPKPTELYPRGIERGKVVNAMQAVLVRNTTSGRLRMVQDEGFYIPGPYEQVVEERRAIVLKQREYALIKDNLTGRFSHQVGAKTFFVGPYEKLMEVKQKIVLQKQEYVRLVDQVTGNARVLVGPDLVVPEASEQYDQTEKAIVIGSDTAVVIENLTSGMRRLEKTPGLWTPGAYDAIRSVQKATVVKEQEYAVIKNDLDGKYRHAAGPTLLFLDPYDNLVMIIPKTVLHKLAYARLEDRRTGEERVIQGPQTIVPGPSECEKDYTRKCYVKVETAIILKADVSVLAINKTTGRKKLVAGSEGLFIPAPYEEVLEVRNATVLKQQEYAIVKNNFNGLLSHHEGPALLFVEANEELMGVRPKVTLQRGEFIRLVNEQTGAERVETGPATLVPDPMEVSTKPDGQGSMLTGRDHTNMVQRALFLDKDLAVLVLNKSSGQERLVANQGVWSPEPYEHVLEERALIRVLNHETMIVRDSIGRLTIHSGQTGNASEGVAFFLPEHSEIIRHTWSSYLEPLEQSSEQRVEKIVSDRIDMRMRREYFSYPVRTNDNVQLVLMGTVFWKVVDVSKLIVATSDPAGDVWHHARSSLNQAVSNATLEAFMNGVNAIASEAMRRELADTFYSDRGVELSSLEVTRFDAVDPQTRQTLQMIIEETTNQITRLQKQVGENNVLKAKMLAELAREEERTKQELVLEQSKTDLIRTRAENEKLQKQLEGEAAGMKLTQAAYGFLSTLNDTVPNITARVDLLHAMKALEARNVDTQNLASGKATLFLTPDQVKLNLASPEL